MRNLTATKKLEYLPILFSRQGGKCIFCKIHFDSIRGLDFVHFNNRRSDNRLENLGLAHHDCNLAQNTNLDYQIIANEQLKKNEDAVLSGREKTEDTADPEMGTEITINVNNSDIAEQFLRERIKTDGSIEFSTALDSIVYRCKLQTGHGSHQAVRNYIKALVCEVGPFMMTRDDKTKKKMIVKRSGA